MALSLHASFICTATADLTNTGFEQGTENWASFVPDEAKDAETSFTVVSENPHSGSRVAKLTSTKFARHGCTPAGSQATLKVTPGERYRITAWVRADADAKPQDNTPGVLVRLALQGPDKKDAPGGHYYAGLNNWIARDRQPPASKLLPTEWSKIESVFQIPDDAAYMSLTLFAWRVQGSVYFDDVSLEKVSGDTPITPLESVTNSGFEQDMTDWAYFCPPESKAAEATFTTSTENPHTGRQSARLYSQGFARHGIHPRSQAVKVSPGERWLIRAWMRADGDVTVAPGSAGALIRLTLKDSNNKAPEKGHLFVGLNNWVGRNLEPPFNLQLPRKWTKIEAVVEIPADIASAMPTLFVWIAKGTIYFDDVSFEKVSSTTPLTPVSANRSSASARPPSAPPASELLTADIQQELFSTLNLETTPALKPVRQAVARKDYPEAVRQLAVYLRTRTTSNWLLAPFDPSQPDPNYKYRQERADSAVVGRITPSGLAELWHTFPGNIIDWYHNETAHRPGLAFNQEWQYQLCRMSFWGDMANAYRATGNEKYPSAWVTQFRSFMAQCPPPTAAANFRYSTWRTIESGIRMRDSWPRAFQAFVRSPSVSDEDLLLYMYSNLQHAEYLKKFPSDWGNWLTMEMCGLFTIGTLFPEFRDATDWRQTAVATMHASIARQFLPDGAQYELAPGYHIVALDENGMAIPRLAKATGRISEIPADYIASMEKGYDYLLYLMTPNRSEPRFNDSWPITWLRPVFNNGLLFFPNRDDWRWIATDGAEGRPPAATSHAFPYAGYYVMRSGWGTDANYLAFDGGLPGYSHSHMDKLNLVFWVYGREILFDGGGGSYEDSKWRQYATDAYSHNVIMVDGKPQRHQLLDRNANVPREPNDVTWEATSEYDFVAATFDQAFSDVGMWSAKQPPGPVTHTRRVLFAKPDLVIVADTLVPTDPADTTAHTYEARWHLIPTATITDPGTQTITTTDPGLPNLAVIPLRTDGLAVRAISAQTEPELLGWHIRKDMDPQYVPATTVTHTRGGPGIQTFITLLYPLKPDEKNPIKTITTLNATDTRLTLDNGRTIRIHIPAAPREKITLTRDT
ncbi:heparinase II/III family protein [Geminisphaera colitermitum]|uniref:heparinase II/III family protein n=1 Tax=Geminisphaera colitermitum TaxID=1148786 RepID=UPI0018E3F35E|nr:heparinase II/III family protein [Geminisphaera colitermitum]